MRSWVKFLAVCSLSYGISSLPGSARADRVHLASGAVIEGKATRIGEKVVVEVDSGQLTLPAASVDRIESSESDVQRVDARYRALDPHDVTGLMALANYCRDRSLRGRERDILRHVIEVSPDHAEARARLGYVHTDAGWVTRDEQMRAQGMVKRDGRWLSPEQALNVERLEAEAQAAALRRDQAQAELESKQVELASKKAELASSERAASTRPPVIDVPYALPNSYYGPGFFPSAFGGAATFPGFVPAPFFAPGVKLVPGAIKPNPQPPPGPGPAPSPIPGFRDPSNMSFQIPGYQDPRNYF